MRSPYSKDTRRRDILLRMSTIRKPIEGPFVWNGDSLGASSAWTKTLDASAIAAIDAALSSFEQSGRPWSDASAETFRLDALEPVFEDARTELEDGFGLARLRGLDVERYSLDQLRALFTGIGHHLGIPVSQSIRGERLLGLTDEGQMAADRGAISGDGDGQFLASRARAYSTGELRFHTDRCDVVGLLCVRKARKGGASRIASAAAIHNAMLERRPDLLELLFQDYPRSRFGEEVDDASDHYMLPVFAERERKFATHYSRTYIEASQTNPRVPRLTQAQNEALDLLAELGAELSHEMTLQPGDIQLLNNHVIYHARTPYEDYAEPDRKRLLLRLWLAMPNSRPLPASYGVLFGDTQPGALRGGIWPPGEQPGLTNTL